MWFNADVSFSLEKGKSKVLQIKLSEIVVVGAVEGSSITIHFSSSLDILQAAHNVFGHGKSKVGIYYFITSTVFIFFIFYCILINTAA